MVRKALKYEQQARQRTKDYIRTVTTILGCQVCDERDYTCIDLHHHDPNTKESDVRTMIKNKWSIQRIKSELVKCVPLCANCHRKYHSGKITKPLHTIEANFLEGAEVITKRIPWKDLIEMFSPVGEGV